MNNINKNYIIILVGISLVILFIITAYILSINDTPENTYETLEIEAQTEEKTEEEPKEKIKIHIAGSVVNEGIVELEDGARIADAIKEAGGTTADANMEDVNLAYKLQDGQKIYIPNNNEEDYNIINEKIGEGLQEEIVGKININTATQTELELLTGIGPSTASKIISYREENGEFRTIEEIKNVPGIGDAKYNNIKNEITV